MEEEKEEVAKEEEVLGADRLEEEDWEEDLVENDLYIY